MQQSHITKDKVTIHSKEKLSIFQHIHIKKWNYISHVPLRMNQQQQDTISTL
jgi:hypothetical protein